MKRIKQIQFHAGSQEELLPDFLADFPGMSPCDAYAVHSELPAAGGMPDAGRK
ncbi:hypothetical protein ACTQ50_03835 [Blautia sp. Sow4_E7]|uniref:hypothetical protein n=1 Tax=Blautia sp. Sow4_E7 TaxID=3438749 RepID=UPI003F916D55